MSFDKNRITFLDIEIYKGEQGNLCSKLYKKSTAGNKILYATSFHPQPLINSIPYSQYLRIKRNCTDEETFIKEAAKPRDRLLARGYSHASLKRSYKQVLMKPRNALLYTTKRIDTNKLRIITKFNQQHQVKTIIEKYWHIFRTFCPR